MGFLMQLSGDEDRIEKMDNTRRELGDFVKWIMQTIPGIGGKVSLAAIATNATLTRFVSAENMIALPS